MQDWQLRCGPRALSSLFLSHTLSRSLSVFLSRCLSIFITEQPASAPHLAHPEECAAIRIVLVTVSRVSRSCELVPDGFDPLPLRVGTNSHSHGARPIHLIITMIMWTRTSRLSMKNSLSGGGYEERWVASHAPSFPTP